MIYFETARLLMRDFEREDLPVFREMNEDQEVMRFFPKTRSHEETDAFYEAILKEWKTYGFGLYAVERKDTGEFIGFIGFHRATFEADFTPCVEIGWRLKKEAWGYGFATEGAKACLKYAEEHYHFDNVYSFTAKINSPSERVMQKIGLKKIKEFAHPNLDEKDPLSNHVLYALKENMMEIRKLNVNENPPMKLLLLADPSRKLVEDYLERGQCFIAEQNDTVIGEYVLLPTRPETVELVNLAVDEIHQGKGVGKQLVQHAVQQAKKQGFKTIEVGTGNSSIEQLALYQKCGFRITGIDRDFFIRHYEEEIYENGLQTLDMIRLSQDL